LQVSRYIHRNPVETKTSLVEDLIDYPWSSYSAYLNKAKVPDWLNRDSVLGELGSRNRYQAYRRYAEQGCDTKTMAFYQRGNRPAVMGDKDFKAFAQTQVNSLGPEVDKFGLKQPVPVPVIIDSVAAYFQVGTNVLRTTRRGPGAKIISRWSYARRWAARRWSISPRIFM
jgi:hypothetical protein